MGKSKFLDARGFKHFRICATRDMACSGAGIHAPDELDIVGRDQLSAAEFGMAAALDAAVQWSNAQQWEFDTMNVNGITKSSN